VKSRVRLPGDIISRLRLHHSPPASSSDYVGYLPPKKKASHAFFSETRQSTTTGCTETGCLRTCRTRILLKAGFRPPYPSLVWLYNYLNGPFRNGHFGWVPVLLGCIETRWVLSRISCGLRRHTLDLVLPGRMRHVSRRLEVCNINGALSTPGYLLALL